MASYVLDTLGAAGIRQAVVVTGADGGRVAKRLLEDPPAFPVRFAEQQR
jgi:dTDP-glucose pyrophosphorylase